MDPSVIVEKGVPELLDKGLLGLAVLALSAVVVYLYMDGRTLRREITALAKETAAGLASSSGTMAAFTAEVGEVSRLTQQVLDVVRVLPSGTEGLARQLEGNANRIDRILDALARGVGR